LICYLAYFYLNLQIKRFNILSLFTGLFMASIPDPKLMHEVKELIVDVCNLSSIDIKPDDITDDEPLVGPGSQLELDSLDVTEIIVAIEKKYGIRVGSMNLSREIIQSTTALVAFIQEKLSEKVKIENVKAS